MVCSCALRLTVIWLQIIFCSCVVMSTSEKNGGSFSRFVGKRFVCLLDPKKESENTKKATKMSFNVFRQYLKKGELDDDRLVSSRAKQFLSSVFTSARNKVRGSKFPWIIVKMLNKFSDQMIKQLFNSVFAKYRNLSVFPVAQINYLPKPNLSARH